MTKSFDIAKALETFGKAQLALKAAQRTIEKEVNGFNATPYTPAPKKITHPASSAPHSPPRHARTKPMIKPLSDSTYYAHKYNEMSADEIAVLGRAVALGAFVTTQRPGTDSGGRLLADAIVIGENAKTEKSEIGGVPIIDIPTLEARVEEFEKAQQAPAPKNITHLASLRERTHALIEKQHMRGRTHALIEKQYMNSRDEKGPFSTVSSDLRKEEQGLRDEIAHVAIPWLIEDAKKNTAAYSQFKKRHDGASYFDLSLMALIELLIVIERGSSKESQPGPFESEEPDSVKDEYVAMAEDIKKAGPRKPGVLEAALNTPYGKTEEKPEDRTPYGEFCVAVEDASHAYHPMANVLLAAFEQASAGKGKERHANDLPFTDQKMQRIAQGQGHIGGLVYQVSKKAIESEKLAPDARVRELLGAIVYAAGAVIFTENQEK